MVALLGQRAAAGPPPQTGLAQPGWGPYSQGVREAVLVVLCILALLGGVALDPVSGIRVGLIIAVAGLVLGSLAGAVYHWRLRAALIRRDALPRRWWINPVALHPRLTDDERVHVLPGFVVGAAFFGLCVLGCAAMVSGLVRLFL